MKQIREITQIIWFLVLLFLSIETMYAQDYKIPLNEDSDDNPPIELDDMTIDSINCIVQHKLRSGCYVSNIDEDTTNLLIPTLKIGDEFIFRAKPKDYIMIENLTLTYGIGIEATLLDPKSNYGGYELSHLMKVSDGDEESNLFFFIY